MKRDFVILCVCASALTGFGGLWLGATASIGAPLEAVAYATEPPKTLPGGREDVTQFFKTLEYTGGFDLVQAVRDESLGRRYYHLKVPAANVDGLQRQVATGWTWGRINRAVYRNNVSSKLPKSRNLPKWWASVDTPLADHMMLDHGGSAKWYLVFAGGGDVLMMWTGK